MKPDRIIAYGCSFTQGVGLKDMNNQHLSTPSMFAWPSVLAELTQSVCVNRGKGGWSNKMIAHTMMQNLPDTSSDTDQVIAMWTCTDRYVVLHSNKDSISLSDNEPPGSVFHMGIWQAPFPGHEVPDWPSDRPEVEAYFRHLYTPYDSQFQNLVMIAAVNRAYQAAGIPLINVCTPVFDEVDLDQFSWFTDRPKLIFDDHLTWGIAHDGHPNESSHREFAQRLLAVL